VVFFPRLGGAENTPSVQPCRNRRTGLFLATIVEVPVVLVREYAVGSQDWSRRDSAHRCCGVVQHRVARLRPKVVSVEMLIPIAIASKLPWR